MCVVRFYGDPLIRFLKIPLHFTGVDARVSDLPDTEPNPVHIFYSRTIPAVFLEGGLLPNQPLGEGCSPCVYRIAAEALGSDPMYT